MLGIMGDDEENKKGVRKMSEILYGKYQKVKCKLYIFEKEDQMRKKIRVSII